MSKQKMNNLLVGGKKMALIALMSLALSPKAKAYDERADTTSGEQTEYQACGTLPSDIGNKEKKIDEWTPLIVCGSILVTGWTMILLFAATKKNGWQELRNSKKSFTL